MKMKQRCGRSSLQIKFPTRFNSELIIRLHNTVRLDIADKPATRLLTKIQKILIENELFELSLAELSRCTVV